MTAGETRTRRYFTLYARPNGLSQARIGIIASRRVAPRAVDRNRMKRMVREMFRVMHGRGTGMDIVVQLRRCPGPGAAIATARAELSRLLEEIAALAGDK